MWPEKKRKVLSILSLSTGEHGLSLQYLCYLETAKKWCTTIETLLYMGTGCVRSSQVCSHIFPWIVVLKPKNRYAFIYPT
jgi:hypothetical protein